MGRDDLEALQLPQRWRTLASAAAFLKQQVKSCIGSTCTVDLVAPGSLARSHGKLRRVYDNRPAEPPVRN